MIIVKIHAARYTLHDGDKLVGQVMKMSAGWRFANSRGSSMRRPEPSAARALEMATILKFIPEPTGGWRKHVSDADKKFDHNQRIVANV